VNTATAAKLERRERKISKHLDFVHKIFKRSVSFGKWRTKKYKELREHSKRLFAEMFAIHKRLAAVERAEMEAAGYDKVVIEFAIGRGEFLKKPPPDVDGCLLP